MKLIIAVLSNEDGPECIRALNQKGYKVTRLSTTGGFLKAGNTTLLCGVEDEQVKPAIEVIKEYSCVRTETLPSGDVNMTGFSYPLEVSVGGATIFVVNVEEYIHF
jgi:uncharacterized protein YaaQ